MNHKPLIAIVEDEKATRHLVIKTLEKAGFRTTGCADGREALKILKNRPLDLVITDYQMPEMDGLELLKRAREHGIKTPFIIITAYGSIDVTLEALEIGAAAFLTKPLDPSAIIAKTKSVLYPHEQPDQPNYQEAEIPPELPGGRIIGSSPDMKRVYHHIHKASKSDASVLITGESGTGKELAAKAIHYNSWRKNGPFVPVNCSVFPKGTLESELFGHVKGAFTDAVSDRLGRFEMAHQGSLFIDEIGDLPLDIQVKLLRVFQEKQFERLGGEKTLYSDFRLISATNSNLKELTHTNLFREDLYYRINVIHIHMPPLRERMQDIPDLLKHFLALYNHTYQKDIKTLSVEALRILQRNSWKGNVRQLENVIESAVTLCEGNLIDTQHLPPEISIPEDDGLLGNPITPASLTEAVAEFEKNMIQRALKTHNGIKTHAAKALGIEERGLSYKMTKYGIKSYL